MAFSVGQNVIYTSVGGKKEDAVILKRRKDFKEGRIETFNEKGGRFDYIISVSRNGKTVEVFCLEKELS